MSNTPPRTIRVPDELWNKAKEEADRRGESVTAAVVKFLTDYIDWKDHRA